MIASETIRSAVTDDGMVLLDVSNGKIFNSNAVGARIWLKLQEGLDLAMIVAQISSEFGLAPERIRPDVEHFIEDLAANNIVVNPLQS